VESCTAGGPQGVARDAREIEAFANPFRRGRVAPQPCHECREISSLQGADDHAVKTIRTQVDRLLDPKNDITLSTCSVRRRSSDDGSRSGCFKGRARRQRWHVGMQLCGRLWGTVQRIPAYLETSQNNSTTRFGYCRRESYVYIIGRGILFATADATPDHAGMGPWGPPIRMSITIQIIGPREKNATSTYKIDAHPWKSSTS
jgi:hypothetical protein